MARCLQIWPFRVYSWSQPGNIFPPFLPHYPSSREQGLTELAHPRKRLSKGILPTDIKAIAFVLALGARTWYCCTSVVYSEVISPGQKAYIRERHFVCLWKAGICYLLKEDLQLEELELDISSVTQQRERFLSSLVPNSQKWSESVQLPLCGFHGHEMLICWNENILLGIC